MTARRCANGGLKVRRSDAHNDVEMHTGWDGSLPADGQGARAQQQAVRDFGASGRARHCFRLVLCRMGTAFFAKPHIIRDSGGEVNLRACPPLDDGAGVLHPSDAGQRSTPNGQSRRRP